MFESLANAKIISLDIETRDEQLLKLGPGEIRAGNNYIAGVALATDDGYRAYYPVAHEEGVNLDKDTVFSYLKTELGRAEQNKIGTRIKYDIGFLEKAGIHVAGKLYDISLAEGLIDENKGKNGYSLNALAQKYLNKGKDDELLYSYLATKFGGKPVRTQQAKRIWRAPGTIVEDYALSDVLLPLEIYQHQRLILQNENLIELFELETALLPILIKMRHRGIRVDLEKIKQVKVEVAEKIDGLEKNLKNIVGSDINLNSSDQWSKYFESLGVDGAKTPKGKLSTSKKSLSKINLPVVNLLREYKGLKTLQSTFLNGVLTEHVIKDRVHAQLHSFLSDEGGTVTGRFSSSDPNMQNAAKTGEGIIRKCFIPDEGEIWSCKDWSQIEYRIGVHYADSVAGRAAQAAYNSNPDTDFHEYTRLMIEEKTGVKLERKQVKNINFGLAYGMGKAKLANDLELPLKEASVLYDAYLIAFPFLSDLSKKVSAAASKRGYIKTLLGRRRRFNLWEAREFGIKTKPLPYEAAGQEYGAIQRAGAYKALNSLLQGGCADISKKALYEMHKAGLFDVLGVPLMLVHDEKNFSLPDTKAGWEADKEATHIMQTCVKLRVPLLVTNQYGKNWGELGD